MVALASFAFAVTVVPARAADNIPTGYDVAARDQLGAGAVHLTLRRAQPAQVVHVARLEPDAPFRLRAVVSNDMVAEPGPRLERTSAMCARLACVAAVNGDFAAGGDEPVGGAVVDGEVVRTPVPTHHQLSVGRSGTKRTGVASMRVQLAPTDLRTLAIDAVNRPRGADQLILYTRAFGPSTATNPHGAELVMTGLDRLDADTTKVVRIADLRDGGDTPVPPGGAVLSGHGRGADALRDLRARISAGAAGPEALLRVDTDAEVVTSTGGTPVLVRDGKAWVAGSDDTFVGGRHPRTAVGWAADGTIILAVADGRQPGHSLGLTLPELAGLMVELGAVEALNLDGGGSATMAVRGAVVNQPSDVLVRRAGRELLVHQPAAGDVVVAHVERPVVTGLVIVPRDPTPERPTAPAMPALPAMPLRTSLDLAAGDPGSNPAGARPAIAVIVDDGSARRWLTSIAFAVLLAVAVQASRAVRSAASSM